MCVGEGEDIAHDPAICVEADQRQLLEDKNCLIVRHSFLFSYKYFKCT